ncbi:MAG: ATP-binding protein [Chloroflexota bacterium]|nr:ATP-binding protein [Chloroflexota bacterium]
MTRRRERRYGQQHEEWRDSPRDELGPKQQHTQYGIAQAQRHGSGGHDGPAWSGHRPNERPRWGSELSTRRLPDEGPLWAGRGYQGRYRTEGGGSRGRRPPLFALMLAAFAMVIVLGVGGMAVMMGLTVGRDVAAMRTEMTPLIGSTPVSQVPFPASYWDPARVRAIGGDVARGLLSAALVVAAVLLGLAAIFSQRISRPISRLTAAARTMASGDLSVRVSGYGVREINELSEAFNSMAGSLAAADGQRRQLTADVAHELRTPLSIIKGRLEGMQDGVYSATPDQITLLLDETALLERMIEDLRILAQADAGQLPLYMEQVRPEELLNVVARHFAPQAADAQVTIRVTAEEGLPDLHADPQRLQQVLGNLLSNALRHTPVGGAITLRAVREPGANHLVTISVQDTGSGIAPADLTHIFERFWKADRARSRSGGAGLGLAIARRIVEAHGGRIWAAGEPPGQGATVGFTLQSSEAPMG